MFFKGEPTTPAQILTKSIKKTMQNTPAPLSRPLLNVILVLIESVLTLVLRFDAKLRQAVYPLAKNETLVAIRTYLPHTQIYATFSYKGVLLDNELPIGKTEADVVINAYSFQLFNALVGHNVAQIDGLQMRGKPDDVALVRAFLLQVGVGGVIANLLHKIKGKPALSPEEKQAKKDNKLTELTQALSESQALAERLNTDNKRLVAELAELKGKQTTTFWAFIVSFVVAIGAMVSHFFI